MVRDFPNSTDQPDEIALTNQAFRSALSGKGLETEDSFKWQGIFRRSVPNLEEEEYLSRYSTISERNFRKITLPFDFKPNLPDFFAKW